MNGTSTNHNSFSTILNYIFGRFANIINYNPILVFFQFIQTFSDGTTSPVYVLLNLTGSMSALACGLGELDIPTAMGILAGLDTPTLTNSCLLTTWNLDTLLPHAPNPSFVFPHLVDYDI